jgi:hypothetical protein
MASQGVAIHSVYGSDGVKPVYLNGSSMKEFCALINQLCPSDCVALVPIFLLKLL